MVIARLKALAQKALSVHFLALSVKTFGELVSCTMQGGVVVMLCFIGLFMKQSWMKGIHFPLSYFPTILLPYINQIFIAVSIAMMSASLISRLLSHIMQLVPQSQTEGVNQTIYMLTAWILPLLVFAINLSLNVTLNQAFLLAFAFSSVNCALVFIVEPRIKSLLNCFLVEPMKKNTISPVSTGPTLVARPHRAPTTVMQPMTQPAAAPLTLETTYSPEENSAFTPNRTRHTP